MLSGPLSRLTVTCCLAATAAAPLAWTTDASGGPQVRSGVNTLQLRVAASAQRAIRDRRGEKLHIVVDRGTTNGKRSRLHLKSIMIKGPTGLRYNTRAFPRCRESDFLRSQGFECPASSRIGTGTATADSRPAVPQLEQLPVTVFNATDDLDSQLRPRKTPLPGMLLDAGSYLTLTLSLARQGTILYENPPNPEPFDPRAGNPTLVRLDVTIDARSRRGVSYVHLPARCPPSGHWRFTAIERHYDGPTLTATHDLSCGRH